MPPHSFCCEARSSASTPGCRRTGTAGGWRWPGYARPKETWHGALDLLDEAERLYVSDFFPNVRPVPALRARVWIAQGRLGEALGWAREQGLSVDDDLSYLREFEHITLARLLLARYQGEGAERSAHEAARLLERLLLAAEEGGRTGRVIEILVLRALAHQALGDIPAALGFLDRAVTLAEPEGYVRVFADEGPPMTSLLRAAAKQGTRRTMSAGSWQPRAGSSTTAPRSRP